jgi:hypothetical protein
LKRQRFRGRLHVDAVFQNEATATRLGAVTVPAQGSLRYLAVVLPRVGAVSLRQLLEAARCGGALQLGEGIVVRASQSC